MTSLALGTVNKIITSKAGYKITGARAGIGVCLTSGATLCGLLLEHVGVGFASGKARVLQEAKVDCAYICTYL